jgi:hypothetical protein
MVAIAQARVKIVGTRPLLFHHFGEDAIPLERGERTGVAGNDPEEWRRTVLALADGTLYLEPTYAFGCLRNGAKYTKKGRGSIQSQVAATLQVMDDIIPLDRKLPEGNPPRDRNAPVYLDVRYVKNPSNRSGNVRYRVAASPGWKCSFGIMWDTTIVSRGAMQAVVVDSGRFVGVGDGRAIGFGRFSVEAFAAEETEDAAATAE